MGNSPSSLLRPAGQTDYEREYLSNCLSILQHSESFMLFFNSKTNTIPATSNLKCNILTGRYSHDLKIKFGNMQDETPHPESL